MVWNACSTLIASFADVSKYGMLPLDWHQVIARFCETWRFGYTTWLAWKNWGKECKDVPVSCSPPRQFCCLTRQRGSSPGHVVMLGWGTRLANCRGSRRIWTSWHHRPRRSNLHHDKMQHLEIGNVLVQPCPRAEVSASSDENFGDMKLVRVGKWIVNARWDVVWEDIWYG